MKKYLLSIILFIFSTIYFSLSAQLHFEKDFALGPGNSHFQSWVEIDGKMYFSGNDGYFGYELWQFDPATEQAHRLTDILPQAGDSSPKDIVKYGDKIYFIAFTGEEGSQIFRFDPQAWEVERVTTSHDETFRPAYLAAYNGKLWFSAEDADGFNLWNYDESTESYNMIPPPPDGHPSDFIPQRKFVFQNKLYFSAYNVDSDIVLWSYDDATGEFTYEPTQFDGEQNLRIVKAVECDGELMLSASEFTSEKWYHYDFEMDSLIHLMNNNSGNYRGGNCLMDKFWYPDYDENKVKIYDPSNGEIKNMENMNADFPNHPDAIKAVGEHLYAFDNIGFPNYAMYKYDPVFNSVETVFEVETIETLMETLMENNGDYYFFGNKSLQREIYKYEPSTEIHEIIADINTSSQGGFSNDPLHRFQVYNDRMYFNAYSDYFSDVSVWSKGTAAGDYVNFNDQLTSGEEPFIYTRIYEVNDRIYFSGSRTEDGYRQLVSYAEGEDTLRWHGNITPPDFNSWIPYLRNMQLYNNYFIFSVDYDDYPNLQFCRFDINSDEYEIIDALSAYVGTPSFIIGDKLIFEGHDTSEFSGRDFYSFDLLTEEIVEIYDDTVHVPNQAVFQSGDKVFFAVRKPNSSDYDLQMYDPATGEKTIVTPPGLTSIWPNSPVFYQNKTWFHFEYSDSTRIYTLDPVTGICLEEINLGSDVSIDGKMIWFDGKLFFRGRDDNTGYGQEVFFYDPATGIVELYADIQPGAGDSSPKSFFEFEDRLYFVANDGFRGEELWSIGNCFSVTFEATPDPMGNNEGAINLYINGGAEPFSFSWNNGATTQNIDGLLSGYYEATVTDANGCEATVFVILEGGIVAGTSEDLSSLDVNIYPNPASDYLNIELSEYNGNMNAYIFNYSGVKVWEEKINSGKLTIDVSGFSEGMYFMVLRGEDNKVFTEKMIVKH